MARKPYTPEQRKAARKASRLRWEAKNPDKVKDRYARRKGQKEDPGFRVCATCNEEKPIEHFKKHGPRGHSRECLVCDPLSTEKPHRKSVARAQKPVVVRVRKEKSFDVLESRVNSKKETFKLKRHEDWVVIVGDIYGGGVVVKHRDGIMMFLRKDGFCRYGVMGDDKGGSFHRLADAEKVRDKLWSKVG